MWRQRGARLTLVAACLAVGLEVGARHALGLGDPPLYRSHPTIDYLLAPDQTCRPFGNRFEVNAYGMRSDPFPARKTRRDELRVLVFGDSVTNGGSLIDQGDLATQRAAEALRSRLRRPVVVGNVSGGGWGPANWLAYTEEFGLLDADATLLVVNAGDAAHAPARSPEAADLATRKPFLASTHGLRYLRLALVGRSRPAGPTVSALPALDALLRRLAAESRVALLLHPLRSELEDGKPAGGAGRIRSLAEARGVAVVELAPFYAGAALDDLYRDAIHPTSLGQQRIGRALAETIAALLSASAL
jgi:lysophospholipase L1-like esterase